MYSEQQNLLHVAFGEKESTCKGKKVYKSLVFKVFFDALSSAYPLFYTCVERKEFENIVREFMHFGAKSMEMWKMPNEFRKFVKKHKKLKNIAFTDELLWFEWVEMKLTMKNYKLQNIEPFSYKKSYKLNSNAVIKKLNYRVFKEGSFEKKGDFYLLAYYDLDEYRVLFREISQVMYLFLKELKKSGSKKAISKISQMSGQTKKEVKEFFKTTLHELNNLRVLT